MFHQILSSLGVIIKSLSRVEVKIKKGSWCCIIFFFSVNKLRDEGSLVNVIYI
jgi:hypothetical protein